MSVRVATLLYAVAVLAIPISVASKFLLGVAGATWIDPTLILALTATLALISRWGDFLVGDLRLVVAGSALLFLLSLVCTISGLLIRPPSLLYDALREPLRLWLNLVWLVLSCWFLIHKPRIVWLCATLAVAFCMGTGIYLHLVAFGLAPASESILSYTRAYLIRQTVWFNGVPIPRMGGLFFESPPFGLFMFSMLIVLIFTREPLRPSRWTGFAISLAVLGMLFSLADQVLLAGSVGLFSSLPRLGKKRPQIVWPLVIFATIAVFAFEMQSISIKSGSSNTGIVTRINGSSVGERSFHIHYGLSLLQADPRATLLGIGPGRYGEYASETGMFVNTVNVQTSEMELLIEWGVFGLAAMAALLLCVTARAWELHGVLGLGLLVSLILADSFQANWKYEAVFLAVAALCTRTGYAHE